MPKGSRFPLRYATYVTPHVRSDFYEFQLGKKVQVRFEVSVSRRLAELPSITKEISHKLEMAIKRRLKPAFQVWQTNAIKQIKPTRIYSGSLARSLRIRTGNYLGVGAFVELSIGTYVMKTPFGPVSNKPPSEYWHYIERGAMHQPTPVRGKWYPPYSDAPFQRFMPGFGSLWEMRQPTRPKWFMRFGKKYAKSSFTQGFKAEMKAIEPFKFPALLDAIRNITHTFGGAFDKVYLKALKI